MRQLSLFDGNAPEIVVPGFDDAPDSPAALARAPVQLGLFDERAVQLKRIGDAIAEERLHNAARWILALRASAPADVGLRRLAADIEAYCREFQRAEALAPPMRAAELLALARSLTTRSGAWARLRLRLLCRVAQEIRESLGDAGELDGQPAGYYLLEAGAFADAKASLTAAACAHRRARTLFLLADAAFALDEPAARRIYLKALLTDPFDCALASVRDPAVRVLPDVARDEFEIEDVPEAWSAPVGIFMGILPSPAVLDASIYSENEADTAHCWSRREAVEGARQFVRSLATAFGATKARDAAVLEARRTMKRLCPTLFSAYLRRMAGLSGL